MESRKNGGERSADPEEEGREGVFGREEIRAEQSERERAREIEKRPRGSMSGARLLLTVNIINQRAKHVAWTLFNLAPLPRSLFSCLNRKSEVLNRRNENRNRRLSRVFPVERCRKGFPALSKRVYPSTFFRTDSTC